MTKMKKPVKAALGFVAILLIGVYLYMFYSQDKDFSVHNSSVKKIQIHNEDQFIVGITRGSAEGKYYRDIVLFDTIQKKTVSLLSEVFNNSEGSYTDDWYIPVSGTLQYWVYDSKNILQAYRVLQNGTIKKIPGHLIGEHRFNTSQNSNFVFSHSSHNAVTLSKLTYDRIEEIAQWNKNEGIHIYEFVIDEELELVYAIEGNGKGMYLLKKYDFLGNELKSIELPYTTLASLYLLDSDLFIYDYQNKDLHFLDKGSLEIKRTLQMEHDIFLIKSEGDRYYVFSNPNKPQLNIYDQGFQTLDSIPLNTIAGGTDFRAYIMSSQMILFNESEGFILLDLQRDG